MDPHVVRWAIAVAVAFVVLCLVYMSLNSMAKSKKAGAEKPEWTVYGSKNCGWTMKQLEHMDSKGIAYTFVDCDSQECTGIQGFPTLTNDTKEVKVGFTPM